MIFLSEIGFLSEKNVILTSNSDKMFIEFKNKFAKFPLISLPEIQMAFPNLDKRRLFEWTKKGYIENVKRGGIGKAKLVGKLKKFTK